MYKNEIYEKILENTHRYLEPQVSFIPEEITTKNQLFQFIQRIDSNLLGIEKIEITFFKESNDK